MRTKLIVISVVLILCASLLSAQTLTSSNYSLLRPKIAVFGGNAASFNYSLNNVEIGNPFGGKITSTNYTVDANTTDKHKPNPPTLNPITTPTNIVTQTLSGTKEKGTAIYINGYKAVDLDYNTTWSCNKALEEDENTFFITARNKYNLESKAVSVSITLDTTPPVIVINTPKDGTLTYLDTITVKGTIDEEPFSEERELAFGLNPITKGASDDAGNTSSETVDVYRARAPLDRPL